MRDTLSDTQIVIIHLMPGIFPLAAFTGVDFAVQSGPAIASVTLDASSSPLFAPAAC